MPSAATVSSSTLLAAGPQHHQDLLYWRADIACVAARASCRSPAAAPGPANGIRTVQAAIPSTNLWSDHSLLMLNRRHQVMSLTNECKRQSVESAAPRSLQNRAVDATHFHAAPRVTAAAAILPRNPVFHAGGRVQPTRSMVILPPIHHNAAQNPELAVRALCRTSFQVMVITPSSSDDSSSVTSESA